jgi:hypothetical protein
VTGSCLILILIIIIIIFFLHTPKSWGGGYYFRLFVTKMTIQRDDGVLPSGFLLANAASAESGGQPEVVKWCC